MRLNWTSRFNKQYKKLPKNIQGKAAVRIRLFVVDPFNAVLHNHVLSGEYQECRSINITGDYRAIYEEHPKGTVTFLLVGTHAELYG